MAALSIHVHFNFIAEWNYFLHLVSSLLLQIFFLVCLKVEINLTDCDYLKPNPIADFFRVFFPFKFLEDISPFCGATDTSVLDFGRHLPWLSKPGWIPLLVCFITCM